MLKHSDIWRAMDRLAARAGLSASGLARRAGLDPTTFNKSKRVSADGKLRWPSTESVAKVLEATATPFADFVSLVDDSTPGAAPANRVPVIGQAQAGEAGRFDDSGRPAGSGWDELIFPDVSDPHAYALEITGDDLEPVFRDGDTLIVSPGAQIRRGDRVVVRTRGGEMAIGRLARETATRIELASVNRVGSDRALARSDVVWMSRVVWAGQ